MTSKQHLSLLKFLAADPIGFENALINVIDTHNERVVDAHRDPDSQDPNLEHNMSREAWALYFLALHENGERSKATD